MKYDEEKIEKMTLNIVGLSGEQSTIIWNVVMSISTRGKTVYSTMMVVK